MNGDDGAVQRIGGESIQGDASGRATGRGFGVECGDGGGVEGDDGKGGIFRAHFFHVMESLKIPGMDIDDEGFPATKSQSAEEIRERIETMELERSVGGIQESLREFGPRRGFAEEEDLERRVLH